MPYHYRAFGLRLASNLELPTLAVSSESASDVVFHLGSLPAWLEETSDTQTWYTSFHKDALGEPSLKVFRLQNGAWFWLRYADGTEFLVNREGTRVWSRWSSALTIADMATYLLNPVMAFLIQLRGVTCLHGSVVEIAGRAVCFVGPSEAGKSTTAAALARHGYPVLSDDIVAMTEEEGQFRVYPASPELRLWGDSVSALYGSPDALPWITPTYEKRYLDLRAQGYRFRDEPLFLGAVYLLGKRAGEESGGAFSHISAVDGLMALVANTWSFNIWDTAASGAELQFFRKLVQQIPVRSLVAHRDPRYLSALSDSIVKDFRTLMDHVDSVLVEA